MQAQRGAVAGGNPPLDFPAPKQPEAFLEAGDGVLAMTASGNAPTIRDAVRFAAGRGAATIGFGGALEPMGDADVTVAGRNIGHVEDLHLVLEQLISQRLHSRIEAGGRRTWATAGTSRF